MQIILADRSHDHFSVFVDPHPHQQRRIPFLQLRIGIAAHLLLHPQRGIEGPLGVILMRKRRAEQGKDAVTQALVLST